MPVEVCIIGAGPAALLAAYAVERQGHQPVIMAPESRSIISPVQCLQQAIPDVPVDSMEVFFAKTGIRERYAAKLYGSPDAPTSWKFIKDGPGIVWPLTEVYDWLWEKYVGIIDGNQVEPEDVEGISGAFEVVISTAPAAAICVNPKHRFEQVGTQIFEQEFDGPTKQFPSVILSGGLDAWFRFSAMRGRLVWEYPHDAIAPAGAGLGIKPVGNTCDCHPRVHRIGRFGKWQRGIQTHHAFRDTVALLSCEGLGQLK